MKKISHRYFHGMSLMSCWVCENGTCWSGQELGYLSCEDCKKGDDLNCGITVVSAYLKSIDSTGKGPTFAVRGDLRIRGKVIDVRTKKPIPRLPVRLVFPNGLCLNTRTKMVGTFVLNIESYEGGQVETIDLGTLLFRKTESRGFMMGFDLSLPAAGARQ